MNQNLMYFPCLAMLLLTGIVLIRMFVVRMMSVKKGQVDFRHFKTYNFTSNVPPHVVQAERNFSNLFEVPTLFYMLCVFFLVTSNVDALALALAWTYVILRCLHSIIHLTSNKLIPRMSVYGLSWLVLVYMAFTLAGRILLRS